MPTLEDEVAQVDTKLISESEDHIRYGHIPKRKDCPICQEAQGPVVRHYQHPTRFEKYGTLHVDLTGPLATGLHGHRCVLIMDHRLQRG
eukprot:3486360-Prorocentrum_lima.AAC.1